MIPTYGDKSLNWLVIGKIVIGFLFVKIIRCKTNNGNDGLRVIGLDNRSRTIINTCVIPYSPETHEIKKDA